MFKNLRRLLRGLWPWCRRRTSDYERRDYTPEVLKFVLQTQGRHIIAWRAMADRDRLHNELRARGIECRLINMHAGNIGLQFENALASDVPVILTSVHLLLTGWAIRSGGLVNLSCTCAVSESTAKQLRGRLRGPLRGWYFINGKRTRA